MGEAEDEVESAKAVIGKRDESIARLEAEKREVEAVIEVLRSDLAVVVTKNEVEVEKLQDQNAGLKERIDQIVGENEKLKRDEGVDLDYHRF